MVHFFYLLCEEMLFTLRKGKNYELRYKVITFSDGSGNIIPIKMEDFFDAEISIYSRAEFFIYLLEYFIQRFSNETPWKNDDFVPQSIIFSLEQWKYHFFTQKFVEMPHFFTLNVVEMPSHYFNDQNIHLLPEEFEFISWKYLHFICFVENLRTNTWKIPRGNKWIFLHKKTPSF